MTALATARRHLRKLRSSAEKVGRYVDSAAVVYLLYCPSTGLTKIGKTTDLPGLKRHRRASGASSA